MATSGNRAIQAGSIDQTAVVNRVAESTFHKAPRLKELFLYLCRASIESPHQNISEHQIGVDVFGREPNYDASVDTIARVQVSQIRKKLQQYYASDGLADPVIIEVPKGSYNVVFRAPAGPAPGRRVSVPFIVLGALSLLLAAVCLWLAADNRQLRASSGTQSPDTPALDHFWRTLFPAGREVALVTADANLMILSDLMAGHTISLFEYRAQNFPSNVLTQHIADPKLRAQATHIAGTHLTPFQDADVVRDLVPLSLRYQFPLRMLYARDFRNLESRGSVILLGHKRGNPWVELFEPRLNFRYVYVPEGTAFRAMLVNQSPQQGEQKTFPVEFGQHGYADVAYLPKPNGGGNALLLSGTDMSSINAAGHFVRDEAAIARLFQFLKVGSNDPVPYFEVLLKTKLLVNTEQGYEIVAHRVISGS